MMKKTALLLVLLFFISSSTVVALSWAYQFVVWNGNVYKVLDESVLEDEIGKKIGKVKTKPNDISGRYYGDASNAYPRGTKYFEIKGISNEEAIAVEVDDNQWKKAAFVHEAPFHWMNIVTKYMIPVIGVVIVAILVAIIVLLYRGRKEANS